MGQPSLLDQYAYVGPAIFEMRQFPETVSHLVEAYGQRVCSPEEVWCPINRTWVRLDGQWISGWRGSAHFAFRPHFWNRVKIRLAARYWRKATLDASREGREG